MKKSKKWPFIRICKYTLLFATLTACQLQDFVSRQPPIEGSSLPVKVSPQNPSTPSPSSTIKATALPSPSPGVAVLPTAIPMPTPSPSPSVSPSTPFPSPSASSLSECPVVDIGFETCAAFYGFVYDINNKTVENAKIDLYKLKNNYEISFYKSTYSNQSGAYGFPRIVDDHYVLKVSKEGYATRLFKYFGLTGYPKDNIDFGGDGSQSSHHPELFLDNSPEVIENKIIHNQANPGTPTFALTFNEPVDKKSIEEKIGIYAASTFFTELIYPSTYGGAYIKDSPLITSCGSSTFEQCLVIKPENLTFFWSSDLSQVTISFKPGFQLPLTKQNALANSRSVFGIAFFDPVSQNRTIYDLDGNGRTSKHFNFQPDYAGPFLQVPNISTAPIKDISVWGYQYSLTDDFPPRLLSLQPIEASLRLNFSEIMAIQTYKYLIAGGMIDMLPPGLPGSETRSPAEYPGNLGNVTGRKTAANYQLKLERVGATVFQTTWKALGGETRYDSEDPSRQSVRLYPPHSTQAVNGFYPAFSAVSTTAVNAGFGQGSNTGQSWILRWQGISNKGEVGAVHEVNLAGNALYTASEWANQLQLALQASSSGEGNWQVQASADGSQLQLKLASESGEFIGWKLVSISSPSAAFPSTLSTPSQNWAAHTDWKWWQAGDKLSIEVINPIFDPAGNSIDPNAKTASMSL